MLRDVFYFGKKPNIHPRERPAKNLEDARLQATTEHFWIINEFCDYTNHDWDYDFDFLPDDIAWHGEHNNAWPSVHQKDSGTWLCPKEYTQHIIYRHDVEPLKRYVDMSNWVLLDIVDKEKFDFSWHPDPTDPPFIYKWGCKFYKSEFKHSLEYRTPGAFQEKWMPYFVELEPDYDNIVEVQQIDKTEFDISWRPDPLDPLYIYIWGNKWIPGEIRSTFEYHTPGATEKKYMKQLLDVLPEYERWVEVEKVDRTTFDFTWRPDPREPPFIYVWGNKYYSGEFGSTIEYHTPGATEKKYMTNDVGVLPLLENFKVLQPVESFDFNWRPNPKEPPYIYVFGNQYYNAQIDPTIEYHTPGATEYKYINTIFATLKADKSKFTLLHPIVESKFDFSWKPNPKDPPYIYVFGNQWHDAVTMPTILYEVNGATEYKYVDDIKAILAHNKENWYVDNTIDDSNFDYSWIPNPNDPEYIYEFGTQHQKTGGPRYIVEGAQEKKYIDIFKVKKLSNPNGFQLLEGIVITDFDFSWHPDSTERPYIYVFGNNLYPAEIMPTIRYVVPGATEIKYVNDIKATLGSNLTNWIIPNDIDVSQFNFSWVPNPKDPAFIYEFGTQWQKDGGPRYVVPGATEIKYEDSKIKALKKPDRSKFIVPNNIDDNEFDYSWHPDGTEQPFIYQFGTQHQKTGGPRYVVDGATIVKYVDSQKVKKLPNRENWEVDKNLDVKDFDFSWHPDDTDEPYTYEFGTQWQNNGGPKYIVPGATQIKYILTSKATKLPTQTNWVIEKGIKIKSFDFSWHPSNTDNPYIYVFGNDKYSAEIMPTVKYVVEGATEVKYIHDIVAMLDINMTNWDIPSDIDKSSFDFSWVPNPKDPAFIYEFGTQWQKTGGPRYTVDSATDIKYVDIKAKKLPNKNNWIIPENLDVTDFDFSWHPDSTDDSYIYEFATQWQNNGGPKFVVDGATHIKYVDIIKAKHKVNKKNWTIPANIDITKFDFSWHPDNTAEPYIYEFATTWNDRGGPVYNVVNAIEKKYVTDIKASTIIDKTYFKTLIDIVPGSFDYSWVPHPEAPPYIYVFGNQWNSAERETTIEYHVPGATEKKYINDIVAKVIADKSKFNILIPIVENEFDFSWRPDPYDPAYIYIFGNTQYPAEIMPTVEYRMEGATEVKYIDTIKAKLAPNKANYKALIPIDENEFDFSWVPNPKDPPYIYVFGNQYNDAIIEPTLEYHVPNATEYKYITDIIAQVLPDKSKFKILIPIEENEFDFSWRPNPKDPPYIYVFGNQWHSAEKEATVEYHVPNANSKKYISDIIARVADNYTNWEVNENIDVSTFDFSWRPDPGNPPYIYQFGTLADDNDGPRYIHPDNNGEIVRLIRVERKIAKEVFIAGKNIPKYVIETTLEDLIEQHKNEIFWALNKNINYDKFDFSWRPSIEQARYVHVFGSPESELTQTYFISAPMYKQGYTNFNFIEEDKKADSEYLATLFKPSDVFFIDRGNAESNQRFEEIKAKFPKVTKTRYLGTWADTINRCLKRCETQLAWILNSELDYTDFDFKYYPNPWQMKMVHVFGTQWSHWGTTFMVNKDTFANDTKYIKIVEHLNNLNFVKNKPAKATNCLYDIYFIDHNNNESEEVLKVLEQKAANKKVTSVKYKDSYLNTFKEILTKVEPAKDNYIWVASSICDYKDFDFSFICDPFAKDNLHVFPSDYQKFGDTFLVDVNKLQSLIDEMNLLEDYGKVQYAYQQRAKRLPAPIIIVDEDTHRYSTKVDYSFPYAIFKTKDNEHIDVNYNKPLSLWSQETKNIEILSTGGSVLVLPQEVKNYVSEELYDYPYITKADTLQKSKPLDIVFLSNGEPLADKHYDYLMRLTKGMSNRVVRVDGINGRAQSYHAAAEASNTPWFFTVFAKLEVNSKFNFNWQPDRLQVPKHYIFNAINPVNGLIYGHQAMIAYNKKLVLNNPGRGLDFTLDDEHEVVDLLSGIARFNTDKFSTWRTSFREVIKLKSDFKDISYERLNIWLTKAEGDYAEDCIQGAKDAVEYYQNVNGDIEKLKLSYEWTWLSNYYKEKYK